jgi:hypothetical protein
MVAKRKNWRILKPEIFWGEIAPSDHIVQVYDNDNIFLDTLAGFTGGGLKSGDVVVVIATEEHIRCLNRRLERDGVDVHGFLTSRQYLARDAEECLKEFMVNGWPDENLFTDFVTELLNEAKKGQRKIRVFGEMVALLWAKGHSGATVRLEHLWNAFMHTKPFSLFLAYPRSGFTQDAQQSIRELCDTHSRIISGEKSPMSVVYKNISKR